MAPPIKGLSGLTVQSMKKYPAILPLYFMLSCGVVLAAGACFRTLTKNPEVSVNRRGNEEPWNAYRERQYKFFGMGRDYSQGVQSQAPVYNDEDKNRATCAGCESNTSSGVTASLKNPEKVMQFCRNCGLLVIKLQPSFLTKLLSLSHLQFQQK